MKTESKYKHKKFAPFNDHGSACKGHGNFMLDSSLESEEDREVLIRAIGNYLPEEKEEKR